MSPTALYRRPASTMPAADLDADLAARLAAADAGPRDDRDYWARVYRRALTLTDPAKFSGSTPDRRKLLAIRLAAAGMRF